MNKYIYINIYVHMYKHTLYVYNFKKNSNMIPYGFFQYP